MTKLEPTFETIEQELLPMIASMLDALLAESTTSSEYSERLRILAEKSDAMARGAIAAALNGDSIVPHAVRR